MKSQSDTSSLGIFLRIKETLLERWSSLSEGQKNFAKKAWGVLTYKWRWQIALNVPYLALFLLDRTVPSVHEFDMALLASLSSKLPIPAFITAWMGIG